MKAHDSSGLAPRICVPSHHASPVSLCEDREFLAFRGDPSMLIEVRCDAFDPISPQALARVFQTFDPGQCVVTCRNIDEGGGRMASPAERMAIWQVAAEARAAFVDIEMAFAQGAPQAVAQLRARMHPTTRLILSRHDFAGIADFETLRAQQLTAEAMGADVVKICVSPATITDAWPLVRLVTERHGQKPLLAIAMGEAGLWSRVLGARFASPPPFTFARSDQGGTAPGQPSWRVLRERYRFANIGPNTPVFGVMGNPIGHSWSPHLHNRWLAALDLPGVYLPWRVDGDPGLFLRDIAPTLGITGLSVTIPHKEAVLTSCRGLHPLAARIGAVNTLTEPESGSWWGSNTDADAAVACLLRHFNTQAGLRDRTVLLLGAGGAARAVAHAVHAAGAKLLICNRGAQRGEELAAQTGGRCITAEALSAHAGGIDAVVNATPLGMAPRVQSSPLAPLHIPPGAFVFDTIYNPPQTQLLRDAIARGCSTLGGEHMFLAQAAAQFALFTGRAVPEALLQMPALKAPA